MTLKVSEKVVVVGGSLAGFRSVEALRSRGYEGEITVISAEAEMPYDRPPLSKQFLRGAWEEDRLSLGRGDFSGVEVDWRLGSVAASLDSKAKELELADGTRVGYGGLIIATGSAPRPLPGAPKLEGMHVLRNLADARALRSELQPGARLVVIGAGFIGMEVAASARELGLEVKVLEAMPVALARGLGAQLGNSIAERFFDHGVEVRCDVRVEKILGSSRVEGVRLADGAHLEADIILVGIGVEPACGWLQGSGLDTQNGILCDGTGKTSLPDVVAVGDVSRWHNPLYREAIRYEHWTSAVEQSGFAAGRLLGGEAPMEPLAQVPYVWSDFFTMRLAIAGDVKGHDTIRICQGKLGEDRFLALFGREGKLVAAVGMKRPRPLNACRTLIAQGASFEEAVSAHS
ncbi:MAG: FAD-dependent oxidoreductase [Myxococcota bacterium]|jgi:NADPH-dependent 2,4-dienoyl-CoA reductase/sulfur reductase-like enzyme|nr:FAD-dependent oxidoreductase [Myxococcota bacterium]